MPQTIPPQSQSTITDGEANGALCKQIMADISTVASEAVLGDVPAIGWHLMFIVSKTRGGHNAVPLGCDTTATESVLVVPMIEAGHGGTSSHGLSGAFASLAVVA